MNNEPRKIFGFSVRLSRSVRRAAFGITGGLALVASGVIIEDAIERLDPPHAEPVCSVPIQLRNETRVFLGDEKTWYSNRIFLNHGDTMERIEGDGSVYRAKAAAPHGSSVLPCFAPQIAGEWKLEGRIDRSELDRIYSQFLRANLLALKWRGGDKTHSTRGMCVAIANAKGVTRAVEIPATQWYERDCEPISRAIKALSDHKLF